MLLVDLDGRYKYHQVRLAIFLGDSIDRMGSFIKESETTGASTPMVSGTRPRIGENHAGSIP